MNKKLETRMKQTNYMLYSSIIGLFFIVMGIVFLSNSLLSIKIVNFLLGVTFIVLGISYYVKALLAKLNIIEHLKKECKILSLRPIINIVIGVLVISFPNVPISMIGIFTGIYCLASAIIRVINLINKVKDNLGNKLEDLILIPFFLALAVFFMFSPYMHVNVIVGVVGVYFILLGLNHLFDALNEKLPDKQKDYLKRKVRIMMPSFVSAFIPRIVLEEVNEYLTPSSKLNHSIPKYEKIKSTQKPDLEVLIHVTKTGFGSMGHMDLIINGKVISYGNYDSKSAYLFEALGDGVLFVADAKEYIPFVIKDTKKTLFAFGLKFNEEQLRRIYDCLNELGDQLKSWTPKPLSAEEEKDPPYIYRLKKEVPVSFYKFDSGTFKTYFVLGSNCVKIADTILGSAGTDVLEMNGIITPGVYYDYLNNEFKRNNSFVISKKIYN